MTRKLVYLPMLFLVLMIFIAGRLGLAAFFAIEPHDAIDSLSASGAGSDQLIKEIGRMEEANRLDPGNPMYLEDLVRLRILHASRPGSVESVRKHELRRLLPEIREAIRLRPVSPYTWTALLYVKSEVGERDEEFSLALANATKLGPWEPEVQLVVADVGTANWKELNAMQRDIVRRDILRGMRRQSDKMIAIITARKCAKSVCN